MKPPVGLNGKLGVLEAGRPAVGFVDVGDCTPVAGGKADDDLVGDPAIGGKDSNRFAPKEDEGLKGLTPPKPVCCG